MRKCICVTVSKVFQNITIEGMQSGAAVKKIIVNPCAWLLLGIKNEPSEQFAGVLYFYLLHIPLIVALSLYAYVRSSQYANVTISIFAPIRRRWDQRLSITVRRSRVTETGHETLGSRKSSGYSIEKFFFIPLIFNDRFSYPADVGILPAANTISIAWFFVDC